MGGDVECVARTVVHTFRKETKQNMKIQLASDEGRLVHADGLAPNFSALLAN